jgi:hypothetical protein
MTVRGTIEARKITLFYMGLFQGLNKTDNASGKIIVRGTMDRGFTAVSFPGPC